MVPGECLNLLPHRCPVKDSNEGLDEALVDGMISIDPTLARINNDDTTLPALFQSHAYAYDLLGQSEWAGVLGGAGNRSTAPQVLAPGTLNPSHLSGNRAYQVTCTGKQSIELALPTGTTAAFEDFVLLTNCPISFKGGPAIRNAVISTTNKGGPGSNASFYGSEGGGGARLGLDDNCDPADNVAMISRGNYNVAAKSDYWGVHIAVNGTADFQSNAESEGLYIAAGGTISNNSNGDFRACGQSPGELPGKGALSLRLIR